MSRIGNKPITIPAGVSIDVNGSKVVVKGPKGTLERTFRPEVTITVEDGTVVVKRPSDSKEHKAFHGRSRALLANMIEGVATGFR